ncbi:DNA glycosylase [Corynespora cassiicola Philippines]|uniref:DNA glycosylase n=1 Tax=Corynespora cassiicola Philippines TaxID=1448308 RepID=A0A2T2NI61_CORCC|nr:DNA glycosylase [Corynespora cassiicola Philippines]
MFYVDPFSVVPTPSGLSFILQPSYFGLIQERICGDLFALVIQAILWNQTTAHAARPILFQFLCAYPSPERLATAKHEDVLDIIKVLGLQNRRTSVLIKLAQTWVAFPPSPLRRYAKRNYPNQGDNATTRDGQLLSLDDPESGWEIAHLPGIGPYAIDSFRIFYRDTLRGIGSGDGLEPEWKRVVPQDKDLRAYLVWRWRQEGWDWNMLTGEKTRCLPNGL